MHMDNNLLQMLNKSGLTQRKVAEEKGVTPETVNRHIHNKVSMTLADASDYARILDCTTHEVLFKTKPADILFYNDMRKQGDYKIEEPKVDTVFQPGKVFHAAYHAEQRGAILYLFPDDYEGIWEIYKGAVTFFELQPMKDKFVSKETFQRSSICKIVGGEVVCGMIYPQPGNKYTVYNPWFENDLFGADKTRVNLKLEWAAPLLATVWNVDRRAGIDIQYN